MLRIKSAVFTGILATCAWGGLALVAMPASAQIFWATPVYPVTPLTDAQTIGAAMPDATPSEIQASDAWQLRAAFNVMALQCQFEPTLLAASSYRAILVNHRAELAKVYATLNGYFRRKYGTVREGQAAMDKYDTRNYSNFSAVAGQLEFCAVSTRLANQVTFLAPGEFTSFAMTNVPTIYASLKPKGDQYFVVSTVPMVVPSIKGSKSR